MTDVLDATKAKREVFMHRYRKSGYALVWISEHICEKYENDCRDNMGISTSTDENREMYMVLFVMLGNSQTLVEKE